MLWLKGVTVLVLRDLGLLGTAQPMQPVGHVLQAHITPHGNLPSALDTSLQHQHVHILPLLSSDPAQLTLTVQKHGSVKTTALQVNQLTAVGSKSLTPAHQRLQPVKQVLKLVKKAAYKTKVAARHIHARAPVQILMVSPSGARGN